jgi:3-oxoacyl-[acyl-carrier protein] reductase
MSCNNKYALVTGGSRGIGKAIAIRLAQSGYNIIINYVSNKDKAEETQKTIKGMGMEAEILQFDVSKKDEVLAAIEQWKSNHENDYISVLVNNAGIRKDNLLIWMPEDDWCQVLDISLKGFYNVTQALLQNMLVKKWGRIINVVSLSGIKGMPGQVNYSAAKGGVIAATKALALEVAKKKVTVNAVAPGFIETDMTSDLNQSELKTHIPVGRFGKPEEVAELVNFLASESATYITGEVISLNSATL